MKRDKMRSEYHANLSLEVQAKRRVVTAATRLAEQMAGDLTLAPDDFDPAGAFRKPDKGRNWPGK